MEIQEEYQKIAREFATEVLDNYDQKVDTIILFGSGC